jgi:hypothetical protein
LPERAQTNEKEKIRQDETRRDLTVGDRWRDLMEEEEQDDETVK